MKASRFKSQQVSARLAVGRILLAAACLSGTTFAEAEEPDSNSPRFALGVRESIQWEAPEPIHDLHGFGVFGRTQLDGGREIGMGIDALSDTLDDPAEALGLETSSGSPPSADVNADVISVWVRQNFNIESPSLTPFALAGLALSSIHMENHRGQLTDGTAYDLRTNAGTEHVFLIGGGVQFRLFRAIEAEAGLRAEYHLANWTIEDRVSGAYVAADDYFTLAAHVGLSMAF